jgi:hypothetical protein
VFGCSLQGCKAVDPLKAERGVHSPAASNLRLVAIYSGSEMKLRNPVRTNRLTAARLAVSQAD